MNNKENKPKGATANNKEYSKAQRSIQTTKRTNMGLQITKGEQQQTMKQSQKEQTKVRKAYKQQIEQTKNHK